MAFPAVSGEARIEGRASAEEALARVASGLRTRFDRVEEGEREVKARASFAALTGMGAPYAGQAHPLIGFDRAEVRVEADGAGVRLRYRFGFCWIFLPPMAIGIALLIGIGGGGFLNGFLVGTALAAAACAASFALSAARLRAWIAETAAASSTDTPS